MQTGWVWWTVHLIPRGSPLGFLNDTVKACMCHSKCWIIFHFYIFCILCTVQPLDNTFITCVNIHSYEHFGRRGFERIFNCLCNTDPSCNSLTRPHNAPQSTSTHVVLCPDPTLPEKNSLVTIRHPARPSDIAIWHVKWPITAQLEKYSVVPCGITCGICKHVVTYNGIWLHPSRVEWDILL